ncbi:hypothetical protein [Chryseobacterium sp. MP_3.2]|uniref:hypothetical protein n=1 Tax=Chryseobacterium sp. MP_3.2 TaxID=3071712 RepID=UPI002E081612|nr:hypothetical protein [Chryseobacterium sp. MP_3.2]
MDQLTELEVALLERLFLKYSNLKTHLPFLKVKERSTTKVGMQVDFEYTNLENELEFEELNALFSGGENIQVKGLKQGLGYVIDITAGQIVFLEFSTYGENWNGQFGDYKIISEEN